MSLVTDREAEATVRALYLAILDREADQDGLATQKDSLKQGGPLEVVRSLIASPEYKNGKNIFSDRPLHQPKGRVRRFLERLGLVKSSTDYFTHDQAMLLSAWITHCLDFGQPGLNWKPLKSRLTDFSAALEDSSTKLADLSAKQQALASSYGQFSDRQTEYDRLHQDLKSNFNKLEASIKSIALDQGALAHRLASIEAQIATLKDKL